LIIDEVSLMDHDLLGMTDRKLKILKGEPDKLFGGIDVILIGDFNQLPPVLYTRMLFQSMVANPNSPKQTEARRWGEYVFKQLNSSTCFDSMFRFKDDLAWGHLLKRLYEGKITDADIKLLNKRVVSVDAEVSRDLENGEKPTFLAFTNESRCNSGDAEDYDLISKAVSNNNLDSLLVLEADITVEGGLGSATAKEQLLLYRDCDLKKPDEKKAFVPASSLLLQVGKTFMCYSGIDYPHDIVNGTEFEVCEVCLKDDRMPTLKNTRFHEHQVHTIRVKDVQCIIVKHTDKVFAKRDYL
jgi:hypothetical protein